MFEILILMQKTWQIILNYPSESSDFINKIDTNSITNSPFFNITTIIEQVINEIESVALQSIDDKSKKLKKKQPNVFQPLIDLSIKKI